LRSQETSGSDLKSCYDLGGASPLTRIVSLVVLGVTFYAGGLLYQRMLAVGQDAGKAE